MLNFSPGAVPQYGPLDVKCFLTANYLVTILFTSTFDENITPINWKLEAQLDVLLQETVISKSNYYQIYNQFIHLAVIYT